mgnify:CR=1 FL=1|jgi:hypothetical protein
MTIRYKVDRSIFSGLSIGDSYELSKNRADKLPVALSHVWGSNHTREIDVAHCRKFGSVLHIRYCHFFLQWGDIQHTSIEFSNWTKLQCMFLIELSSLLLLFIIQEGMEGTRADVNTSDFHFT